MLASARTLLQYLRAPAARSADEFGDAIQQEIAFHLGERARAYMADGMSEDEAHRAALARFGDASRIAAECHLAAVGGLAFWHRIHLLATAVLTVAVAILWFTAATSNNDQLVSEPDLPPGIATMLNNDWSGDITGQILNERAEPVNNARVLVVVKAWPDHSYFQRAYTARTDANGRFLIEDVHPVNEQYEVQIAAVADNRALKSAYYTRSNGTLEPVLFELPPSAGLVLQFEDESGGVLPTVEVLPHGRLEVGGAEHLIYFDSAQSLKRRTDSRGRVELPYFQPGDTASILLRTSQGRWEPREVTVPEAGGVAKIRASRVAHRKPEET